MQIDKKFISRMTHIYGLIVVVSNILAVIVPTVVSTPLGDSENMRRWSEFLSSTNLADFSIVAAFSVPTVVCFSYSSRIFKSEEKITRSVAEIPSVFSISSLIGWNLYYLLETPFVIYAKIHLGIRIKGILISSWMFALFSGLTAWTISYLAIEILNRTVLLPKVFPEGHIRRNSFSVRPVFKHLLLFCFVVSSVFPSTLLLTSLISVQVNNSLPVHAGIIFITALLLLLALAITLALSRIIIRPLNELTEAAGRIKDGDYKTRVSIVTNDELGTLADSFNDMADSLAEKEFMRDTFGKVVDPEVRDYLMKGAGKSALGEPLRGETRTVTVLFCDIRNFTAMSEKMAAADVVSLLNRYFTELGKCITAHHGIINKYIGDAIMAIFGAPMESDNCTRDAFAAALEMRDALERVNAVFKTEGRPQLNFGIGIHTGPVFAGTIGAESRMEYTVIGDTVNTASRLEALCKAYKVDLLVSEAAAHHLDSARTEDNPQIPPLVFVAEAEIRGKSEPMRIFTA